MPTWHWSLDRCRAGTLCGLLLAAGSAHALQNSQLEVHLNAQNLHQTATVLIQPDGRVLVRKEDLLRWRLRLLETPEQTHQNEPYILLDNLGLLTYRVDDATQSLQIKVPAENLLPSDFNANTSAAAAPQMPAAGGFLNYDVSAQRTRDTDTVGTLLDAGLFAGGGVFTTQVLNRALNADGRFVRLESTLTLDRPEQRASLRMGDAISRGGAWGRPVRFGGLQWGTNFATRPDFVTFPIPSITGSAALPSTAEVFINNVRTYKSDIQAGPFSMNELPVVTGQGEVKMVVRDLLGREQVIVQPYYASRSLLRRGLEDVSYEIGTARQNFSTTSNDYGPWLMAGTRRYGFTERFTGELHAELAAGQQTAGLAGTTLVSGVGVVDAAVAASRSDLGAGGLLAVGLNRQTPGLSFGLRTQLASEHFKQHGLAEGTPAPSRQTTANVGWSAGAFGTVGLGFVRMDQRGQQANEIVSASFSQTLGPGWALGLFAFKSLRGAKDHAVGIVLTHALGQRTTVSVNLNQRNGPDSAQVQVQQNLPAGSGVGYRVLASSEGSQRSERIEGSVNLQTDRGTYALEASRFQAVDAYRVSASGGLAVLGGQSFLARRLGDSFAVVRVPGYPNVQVYAENQPVARTDNSGAALVPGLRPYQKNRIGIEQGDLPLDARVGSLEVLAVPYYRSGYDLVFPIEKARGGVLRVVMANHQVAPAGAQARIVGRDDIFPVAQDGEVYLSGLALMNRVELTWGDVRCGFQLPYTESEAPLPDLGQFVCREMAP